MNPEPTSNLHGACITLAFMQKTDRIFVAGHRGLAGGAILRELQRAGHSDLLTRTSQELDLRDRSATRAFFEKDAPRIVVVADRKSTRLNSSHRH